MAEPRSRPRWKLRHSPSRLWEGLGEGLFLPALNTTFLPRPLRQREGSKRKNEMAEITAAAVKNCASALALE
jgi:hypothetical protein